jgi:predicted SAM-dependent methyltransferase
VKTLNLGAGNRIIENAVNHDLRKHRSEIDVAHDLNRLPWPWEDEAFDSVVAWAVLEHLDIDLLTAMDEMWRVLVPDGEASIKLPHWQHEISYGDPTHRYVVGRNIFDTFDPGTDKGERYDFYTDRRWYIVDVSLENSSVYGKLRKLV